jgi:hypothetical protein
MSPFISFSICSFLSRPSTWGRREIFLSLISSGVALALIVFNCETACRCRGDRVGRASRQARHRAAIRRRPSGLPTRALMRWLLGRRQLARVLGFVKARARNAQGFVVFSGFLAKPATAATPSTSNNIVQKYIQIQQNHISPSPLSS